MKLAIILGLVHTYGFEVQPYDFTRDLRVATNLLSFERKM